MGSTSSEIATAASTTVATSDTNRARTDATPSGARLRRLR